MNNNQATGTIYICLADNFIHSMHFIDLQKYLCWLPNLRTANILTDWAETTHNRVLSDFGFFLLRCQLTKQIYDFNFHIFRNISRNKPMKPSLTFYVWRTQIRNRFFIRKLAFLINRKIP